MRIAVIGAGLIGVTTASELATEGHEVIVFERRGSIAAEGSFAHAGLVAPGLLVPWSEPSLSSGLLWRSLLADDATSVASQLDPSTLAWLSRRRRASGAKRPVANLAQLHGLAAFSHERLRTLSAALELDHEVSSGCLVVFPDAKSAARLHADLSMARDFGLRVDPLDADQCRQVEPGLNPETPLFGGVHLPTASVGNARQFTLQMRSEATRLGVTFRLQSDVVRLRAGPRPCVIWTPVAAGESSTTLPSFGWREAKTSDAAEENFNAVVLCTGTALDLLRRSRLSTAVLPLHGWSLTAPMRVHEAHPDHGPRSVVIDARSRVAIARVGGRIRVSGGVRLGGPSPERTVPGVLYRSLDDWFPGTVHASQAQQWCGPRPTPPDGMPLIGASGLEGVWLNLGHGAAGWTLACGSARLLADALSGREPSVASSAFDPARWR